MLSKLIYSPRMLSRVEHTVMFSALPQVLSSTVPGTVCLYWESQFSYNSAKQELRQLTSEKVRAEKLKNNHLRTSYCSARKIQLIKTVNISLIKEVFLFTLQSAERLISYFKVPINGVNVYRKTWRKKWLGTGRSENH